MPTPTDVLAERIQETNERLGEQIRESNQHLANQIEASNHRLTKAIDELVRKVDEGQKEFVKFRLDVTDKLSAIQESNQHLAGQIEASNHRLTKANDDLVRKGDEDRKEFGQFRLEVTDKLSAIQNSLAWAKSIAVLVVVPMALGLAAFFYKATDRAARIEESIERLSEHASEQDERIARLIELFEDHGKGKTPAVPPTMNAVPPAQSGGRSGPNETRPQAAHEESLSAAEGEPSEDRDGGDVGDVAVPAPATAKGDAARPQ